jgi:LPS O-antigen subunit length determinant protein (WzzB/FepE family)
LRRSALRSKFKLQFASSAALRWRKHAEGVNSERRAKSSKTDAYLNRQAKTHLANYQRSKSDAKNYAAVVNSPHLPITYHK